MFAEYLAAVLDWLLNKVILIICILLFLMCLYAGYDTYMVYYHANDDSIQKFKPTQTVQEVKKALGEDAVAWLTIDDTTIDYPVMQGDDNSAYLNTDPYGQYSLSGSIFLDSRNTSDFSDHYNLVYGHHMDHGSMFGSLDDFVQQDYFDQHRSGTLICENGTYHITLFAAIETDASVQEIFVPNNDKILSYLEGNAGIYYEPENDHIIALSTCAGAASTGRTVVFGTLTQTEGGDFDASTAQTQTDSSAEENN